MARPRRRSGGCARRPRRQSPPSNSPRPSRTSAMSWPTSTSPSLPSSGTRTPGGSRTPCSRSARSEDAARAATGGYGQRRFGMSPGAESRVAGPSDPARGDQPELQLRPFRQSDLATLRDLLRQLGYDVPGVELAGRIARVLEAADHHLVIAELEGRIAGLLHVFKRPALEKPCEAVIQALVVDATLRGRGIGRALMRAAEAWAKAPGLGSVALHTRQAQTFYEGIGYSRIASSDLMRKALRGGGR